MAASGDERVIVVAMDGSPYADYAFEWYMKNIHRDKDFVVLVNTVEMQSYTTFPMGMGDTSAFTKMLEEELIHAEKYLHTLTEKMKSSGLHGKVRQVRGPAREEILRVAEEEGAKMIVTGTRGMGKVRRTFLGSVSDHILHHSHVPVVVCRHKEDHHHDHH
ncbi:hypothetical protein CHS0354_013388 [Potamilus streckersoni]|uniref:UspA domain-containing protein n=1 Tax=Potamilus streckersoni TaxID=2493646 RepID=A0AAE0RVW7_9BIVA|nr:hypothetical protein CHS0354_013388 [Potamilus streckersoni]